MPNHPESSSPWWKEAIVYQIYPRSFQDSNGDGVGDLRGIIQRLDYIESLGINTVWLNPIFDSPNDDNGYDIRDYRSIMTEFGTMDDFDELLAGLHARDIRLILDLVVNHSSDEHRWFRESRKSRDNPYRDYYHWVPAEHGKPAHRWSFFDPNADAWRYDATTDSYYLHYFSQKQPDLKWENPQLRREVYDLMHFWFKKGIDGFRMDVITFLSKDTSYPPKPDDQPSWVDFYASGPRLHEFLREMHDEVLQHYDALTVGEGTGTSPENVIDFVHPERRELNLVYHFDHIGVGVGDRKRIVGNYRDHKKLQDIHLSWDSALLFEGWPTIYLGNHDQPRMVTRWGNDAPEYRDRVAKLLNTWLLTMRGVPFLYQGDELGMTNPKFDHIEQYRDLEVINWYHLTKAEGGNVDELLESWKILARDNGRTPVQWDASPQAGFTTGEPWLAVNQNYREINAAQQEEDPDSVLNHFRRLIRLRREHPVLTTGHLVVPEFYFTDTLKVSNPNTIVFQRVSRDLKSKLIVVLNMTAEPTPQYMQGGKRILYSNYSEPVRYAGDQYHLQPYHALVIDQK